VLSAEEAGWYKPHPSMYREACRRLGSNREETVYVAGSAYDAAGARDAGLRSILVRRRPDQVAPAGIPVVRSLDEAVDRILEADARSAT
jgi:FMN phosphatase YigB (HAD superfamily)